MEKRLRDYLRHLEKIDYDVISEEEIWEEREGLELRLTEIHQEMLRILVPMCAFLICACIFLAAAFNGFYIGNFIAAGVCGLVTLYLALTYKNLFAVTKQLCAYVDKLTLK
ncbi:hypothetical protein D6855_04575 [Butyrivibrio sp. CB08]|uniref:hypothetical protein n=1 Tax=Butyrivibrio sp. CB08 TaxID=2364879 RepID=UPI000EA9BB8E|nr:hypothetical protein [Butyrivibrio sp. CB08]RKM61177.1 hypothetical protein D6855_04575 [Butyrivibrio sp. CB08]